MPVGTTPMHSYRNMQKPLDFETLIWNIEKFEFKYVRADCWKPVELECPISRLHLTPGPTTSAAQYL